ncbi:lipoxygenase homology domain-containing protein 1-like [Physella acuta]|uniref:lipoxygenase homology domain-containing protein 1-like n=1 Tax=Physella acuta TaxID=109671 RepID=UPI0027DDA54B|nr:lipoxygenase homology domain-containing protein 1-like [Physella acuta]
MMKMSAIFCLLCLVLFIRPGFSKTIDYKITIKTGDVDTAGTDASVFITIFGSSGSTKKHYLPGSFERGDVDTFIKVNDENVGQIQSIEIGHDNGGTKPGWYLDYVTIDQPVAAISDNNFKPGFTHYLFSFNNWIAADDGDKSLVKKVNVTRADVYQGSSKDIEYKITIKTGDVDNAGTDASVFITIFGSSGSTKRHYLPGSFDRGDVDTFIKVNDENVGRIQFIEIGHDNGGTDPGWYLDNVTIDQPVAAISDKNIKPGFTHYLFSFNNWIAADAGDDPLVKKVNVARADVYPY